MVFAFIICKLHQPQENDKARCNKHNTVESVHHAAMSGHNGSIVLDAEISFNGREREIAKLGYHAGKKSEAQCHGKRKIAVPESKIQNGV